MRRHNEMNNITKITILIDAPDSFLHEYVSDLMDNLKEKGHAVSFYNNHKNICTGDILFLLGCRTILPKETLNLNRHNIVIHPSKLPEGRGSAALAWKILEGENTIYITLFEASESVDSGSIYYQEKIEFEGYELCDAIRHKQALKTIELVLRFVDEHQNLKPAKQRGERSFYRKRTPKDSKLDTDKTIREQFNLLRVVDNKRYPAFFFLNGYKYILKIYQDSEKK